MSRKKRKPGDKLEDYETKISILEYLSDGKMTTPQIRDYLRINYNIREKKGIDKHLRDLINNGLVIRQPTEPGKPTYYYMDASYEGFKRNFHYFYEKEPGNIRNLLQTSYTCGVLTEDIFAPLSMDLLKIVAIPILKIIVFGEDIVEQEPELSFLYDEFQKNENLQEVIQNPQLQEVKSFMVSMLSSGGETIDFESMVDLFLEKSIDSVNSLPLKETIAELLFPPVEREEFLHILHVSPSAVKTIVELKKGAIQNRMPIIFAYMRYYLPIGIYAMLEFRHDIERNQLDIKKFVKKIKHLSFEPLGKGKQCTPLLAIMQSHFITDILSGKVIADDWVTEYYMELFSFDRDRVAELQKSVREGRLPQ